MTNTFLPFARPSISQQAIDEVVECLRSGWITTGPRVQKFEQDLQAYLHAPHVATLASATAGLQLALLALDLQPGDEVITTPLTFIATLNTIVQAGAKPVLVDIDHTYNLDVTRLEQAITPRTRVIMPVHFTGLPVDLDPIYALAKKHQLHVIEDAAQAIGAGYKGRLIGSFGDTQVFSFHPNKNMTTGEGGAVTSRDAELIERVRVLRFHGIDRSAWDRYGKKGDQGYNVIQPGFKYNMMDIQAALGIHQLADLEGFIAKRTVLAQRYLQELAGWPELTLPQLPNYEHRHPWHLFCVLINPHVAGINRDQFMQQMKEHNIGTGLHYQPAHLYQFYQQQFGFKAGDFPKAEDICSRIVSLPLFPDLTQNDQERVIHAMRQVLKGRALASS
jgi:dTDP-4-amino-4,6-dideoxygalactose transaminase